VHNALSLGTGSKGSIQLFGALDKVKEMRIVHRMLSEHLLAEKPVKTEANGRTVYEWLEIPGRDNEGLDCLVGCAVAACISGIVPETERIKPKPPEPMSLADYAAAARG
jgi:phage terminase large subunit GpA-like protein